ncbi:hypothetical protein ANCDUO_16217 [Ancylostoma duodenale]|uniref:Uncharacterized protein n=1 Tax=Ancylostoma duodenale TaxID=51022 RepID=A0A0C2G9L8_9BILA|nr:hypothetical protein ANCDUO_16217 [Ancylostoma duodenale]
MLELLDKMNAINVLNSFITIGWMLPRGTIRVPLPIVAPTVQPECSLNETGGRIDCGGLADRDLQSKKISTSTISASKQ